MAVNFRRWLPIVAGIAILLAFIAIGAVIFGVAWIRQNVQIDASSESDAETAFQEVQKRFAGRAPLVTMTGGVPSIDRAALEKRPPTPLKTMHVIGWDPDDQRIARVSIPFWLLRLKETPISFGAYAAGADRLGIQLRARDIERFGPGIIVEAALPNGARALIWVE